jgi:hypothetical protein
VAELEYLVVMVELEAKAAEDLEIRLEQQILEVVQVVELEEPLVQKLVSLADLESLFFVIQTLELLQ